MVAIIDDLMKNSQRESQLVQVDSTSAFNFLLIYIDRLLTPLMSCIMKDLAKAGVI